MDWKRYFKIKYYDYIYEPVYLLYHSIKDIFINIIEFLEMFKKPGTWSAIILGSLFLALLYRNVTAFKWLIPIAIIIYIVRQRIEGEYRRELKKHALRKGKDILLEKEYEKYKRKTYFMKQQVLSFQEWKQQEIKKIDNR